jgi:hypothetical protein
MIHRIIITIFAGCMVLSNVSCEKMLEVEPRNSLAPDDALATLEGVQATLNGLYGSLRNSAYYGINFIIHPELLADNVRIVNAATQSGRGNGYATNNAGFHFGIWATVYSTIARTNLVIDAVDKLADGTAAQKAAIKAQSLFIRALCYFDLAKSYGYNPNHIQNSFSAGVPLLTDPVDDLTEIMLPERASVAAVFGQVEKDLLEAITLFNTAGVNASAGKPLYATRGASQALLSRLYLYWAGDKTAQVIAQATAAIESGIATFPATPAAYISMWAQPIKPESLFEIQFAQISEVPQTANNNTIQANYQQRSVGTGWGDIVVSNDFIANLEAGDARASVLLPYTRSDGEKVQQTNKFQGSKGTFGWDNVPVIRLSEMYLNRAEAYARMGGAANEQLAQADLNKIRTRVGLSVIQPTGQALIDAILKERRMELAFEGQRFFDLTRLGKDIPKETVAPINFKDYRILPPVPLSDLQINPNLVPNPGY